MALYPLLKKIKTNLFSGEPIKKQVLDFYKTIRGIRCFFQEMERGLSSKEQFDFLSEVSKENRTLRERLEESSIRVTELENILMQNKRVIHLQSEVIKNILDNEIRHVASALKSSEEIDILIDKEGKIKYVSPRIPERTDYKEEELLGHYYKKIMRGWNQTMPDEELPILLIHKNPDNTPLKSMASIKAIVYKGKRQRRFGKEVGYDQIYPYWKVHINFNDINELLANIMDNRIFEIPAAWKEISQLPAEEALSYFVESNENIRHGLEYFED